MQEINFAYDSIYRAFKNQIAAKWGYCFLPAVCKGGNKERMINSKTYDIRFKVICNIQPGRRGKQIFV